MKPSCSCTGACAVYAAFASSFTSMPNSLAAWFVSRIPVRADIAMSGEITLRGDVLQIGGLKEKLLAAHRGGIKMVLIPQENVKDLAEIPDNAKNRLETVPVKWIDRVFEVALERQPEPLPEPVEAAPIPPKPDDQTGAVTTTH